MPHSEGTNGGRIRKQRSSLEGSDQRNHERFIADRRNLETLPVHDSSPVLKEKFESRPNNLDFYNWQPGPAMDNTCHAKTSNEDREWTKWSPLEKNYGLSEDQRKAGSRRKAVNRQPVAGFQDCLNEPPFMQNMGRELEELAMSNTDLEILEQSREKVENEANFLDADQLLEQLKHLQGSIAQASGLLDKVKLLREPQRSEQRAHLSSILKQLKEEEYGYKLLLRETSKSKDMHKKLRSNSVAVGSRRTTRENDHDSNRHESISKPNNRCKLLPAASLKHKQIDVVRDMASDDQSSTAAESEVSAVSAQRRNLREKLKQLQEKKFEMDELLGRLDFLKANRASLENDGDQVSVTNSLRASTSADRTAGEAEQVLTMMQTRHKLKKLRNMRDRLEHLRTLSEYYKNCNNGKDGVVVDDSNDDDDIDDEERGRESQVSLVHTKRGQLESSIQDGNAKETSRIQNLASMKSEPLKGKRNGSMSSDEKLRLDNDRAEEIAKEMSSRQLEAANKLRRLTQLIAMIQQSGDSEDLAKALSELAEEAGIEGTDMRPEDEDENDNTVNYGEQETQNGQPDDEEALISQKMKEQQEELQNLIDERQRLLKLRAELDRIQKAFPDSSGVDEQQPRVNSSRTRHPLDGRWVTREQRASSKDAGGDGAFSGGQETVQVTFQDPLESVVSNEEVYDQMRWQRMMREELREKKKDIGDVTRKRSVSNQDGRSEGASTSRSDQYSRTSPSEDVTMATWGGSTAGNLESIEENENRSDNESEEENNDEINENEKPEDDGDDENDDDDNEDIDDNEAGNLMNAEEEEENGEEQEENVSDDDDYFNEKTNIMNVAPARRWRSFQNESHNGTAQRRHPRENSRYAVNSMKKCSSPRKRDDDDEENSSFSFVRESIRSLKKQMAKLTDVVKKSRWCSDAASSEQAVQMQQNQLFLELNQSYFQLVVAQRDLTERFNNLEQLVLSSQAVHNLMEEPFENGQEAEKFRVSPFPPTSLTPRPYNRQEQSAENSSHSFSTLKGDFADSHLSFMKRASPVITVAPALEEPVSHGRTPIPLEKRPAGELVRSFGRLSGAEGANREQLSENFQNSPNAEDTEGVLIRQQKSSAQARACAMAHLASQKIVNLGKNKFFRADADDNVSLSSVAGSCSDSVQGNDNRVCSGRGTGISNFEKLSEEIYSEVATLISQNEECPKFLMQLFRQLQHLSTDFLRQKALYALQHLLSSSSGETEMPYPYEPSPTSQRDWNSGKGSGVKQEGAEEISSGQSTPSPCHTNHWDDPFAHDPLEATVIHFDKMMQSVREMEQTLTANQPATLAYAGNDLKTGATESVSAAAADNSSSWSHPLEIQQLSSEMEAAGAVATETIEKDREESVPGVSHPHITAHQLDQKVREIMMEVIPVVKDHVRSFCSQQFLQYIQNLVVSLVHQNEETQPEFVRFFHKQLTTILTDSLAKFEGHKISECGEDLLVDISEILFSELGFFYLMQNVTPSKAKVRAKLMTWRKDSQSKKPSYIQKRRKAPICLYSSSSSDSDESVRSDLVSVDQEKEPSQPTIVMNADEEEECGKDRSDIVKYFGSSNDEQQRLSGNCGIESDVMDENLEDDEYYTEGTKDANFRLDVKGIPDDSFSINVKIELAASETKPFTRIGSDEDDEAIDEAASADEQYETAVSREAEKERCSKDSNSSEGTGSSVSMEDESNCKRLTEEEEKDKDTKEESTAEMDCCEAEESFLDTSDDLQFVETNDGGINADSTGVETSSPHIPVDQYSVGTQENTDNRECDF